MAGISTDAYYKELKKNPQFNDRMQRAQQYVSSLASRTIAKAVRDGDSQTAKRYMEHRDERYKKENKISLNANTEMDPET